MIEDDWRYFAPGGAITPGGPSTWHVLDWDQRRIISVTMDEDQESEDIAIEHLKKHINTVGPDVHGIGLSPDGSLASESTDPKDDVTYCVYYPPLKAIQRPNHISTVPRSRLLELDRPGPNVDLVSHPPCRDTTNAVLVFKYYFLVQFLHRVWDEMNLWMRLPSHPNIVPFDRLVVDELHGNVVGFTSVLIPGGTIQENKSRTFKLTWLQQLTCVVDDLNLKYGIAHQDIAPRNLAVYAKTDSLMLFDFNFSGRIGSAAHEKDRDDVKGVIFTLYEIITRDTPFPKLPFDQQNSTDVEGLQEWVQHPDVKLDHSVSTYRSVLASWVKERRQKNQINIYTEAPEYIDWPEFPDPPPREQIWFGSRDGPTTTHCVTLMSLRKDELQKGSKVLNWERPAQNKLRSGDRVLASGQLMRSEKRGLR